MALKQMRRGGCASTFSSSPGRIRSCSSIANDGELVPADLIGRMFDPYVSGKSNKENMGLGLAIVKKIVIEHGGEITYRDADGRPTFIIVLPRVFAVTEPASRPTVLVLDDEKNIRRSIELALEQEGFQVITAPDVSSALRTLHERIVEVLIIDIQLGEIDGITFFRKTQADGFSIPAIFISGHATLTQAALAVKSGGFDFIEKPFSAEKIVVTVRRCLEMSAIKERLRLADVHAGPSDIVGESRAIKQVVAAAVKVARTQANVLIIGESGTGKELVAGAIHAQSQRSDGPMVKVNCSAIPDALLESELFGYEKGAFTGAVANKKGLFEIAHRGTIFLDEVADLSLPAQAKILRVLQSGEIQKVGAQQTVKVDVRVLSGTHKDLKEAVAAGLFREDLFYRLNVVPIRVPALRERPEDIPLLVSFFARRICERTISSPRRSRRMSSGNCNVIAGRGTCASCKTYSSACSS